MHDLEDRALTRHRFHGDWNYTLLPAWRPAPPPPPHPAPPRTPPPGRRHGRPGRPELTGLPRQRPRRPGRQPRAALGRRPRAAPAPGPRPPPPRPHRPARPVKLDLHRPPPGRHLHHRHGMPYTHSPPCSAPTAPPSPRPSAAHRPLLGPATTALAPGPARLRTPADLRRLRRRRRHHHPRTRATQTATATAHHTTTPDTPQTHIILECLQDAPMLRRTRILPGNWCSGGGVRLRGARWASRPRRILTSPATYRRCVWW